MISITPSARQRIPTTRPGTSRKVSAEQIETDADKALLTISKQILQSKEFDAIERHDEQTRDYLRRRALPFPFKRGIYLLPIALIAQVEAQLDACEAARQVLIRQACDAYPRLIEEIRGRLGSLFNAADYPPVSQLAKAYSRDIRYLTLTVPGSLKAVSQAVFERERARAQRQWEEATELIRQTLRQGLYELVGRMVDRLTSDNGKPRVFRDSLVSNLADFLEVFDARNLSNDEDLAALVERCRELMAGVEPKDLRTDAALREQVQRGFSEVKATLDRLPPARASRRIRFEEDEEEGTA